MERLLPHNMEAEQSVLGCLIIDKEAILQVIDILQAEDFYRDAHRSIYEVILFLFQKREVADMVTICDELSRRNKLEEVGGPVAITSLINQIPSSINAEHYARIVARDGCLRRLIQVSGDIAALAYEGTDAQEALERSEELLFAVQQKSRLKQTKSPLLRDALAGYLERLDQLSQQHGTMTGVPTGFSDLDRMTGGLQRSDLIILAARPAIGKSGFALSLAHNAAVRHKQHVGIFSLEMSQEQMLMRLVSMDSRVDQQRLRMGLIEDDEWDRLIQAMNTLGNATILIDDTASISTFELRSKARKWKTEYEIDLLIVDYLQLMRAGDGVGKKGENREVVVSEIVNELKALARELDIPILALAQLSRAVEQRHSKVPQLSDLRESGALEQTADIVMFIYRDDVYNPETERRNQADIIVAKHRNGPVGETVLYFEKHLTYFRNLDVHAPEGEPEGDEGSSHEEIIYEG